MYFISESEQRLEEYSEKFGGKLDFNSFLNNKKLEYSTLFENLDQTEFDILNLIKIEMLKEPFDLSIWTDFKYLDKSKIEESIKKILNNKKMTLENKQKAIEKITINSMDDLFNESSPFFKQKIYDIFKKIIDFSKYQDFVFNEIRSDPQLLRLLKKVHYSKEFFFSENRLFNIFLYSLVKSSGDSLNYGLQERKFQKIFIRNCMNYSKDIRFSEFMLLNIEKSLKISFSKFSSNISSKLKEQFSPYSESPIITGLEERYTEYDLYCIDYFIKGLKDQIKYPLNRLTEDFKIEQQKSFIKFYRERYPVIEKENPFFILLFLLKEVFPAIQFHLDSISHDLFSELKQKDISKLLKKRLQAIEKRSIHSFFVEELLNHLLLEFKKENITDTWEYIFTIFFKKILNFSKDAEILNIVQAYPFEFQLNKNTKTNSQNLIEILDPEVRKEILNMHMQITLFPMVVVPKDWDRLGQYGGSLTNNLNGHIPAVSTLKKGTSFFDLSEYAIKALNDIQKIPYKINKRALKILEEDFEIKKQLNILEDKELFVLYLTKQKINKLYSDILENPTIKSYLIEGKNILFQHYKKINDLKNNIKIKTKKKNKNDLENEEEIFDLNEEENSICIYKNDLKNNIKIESKKKKNKNPLENRENSALLYKELEKLNSYTPLIIEFLQIKWNIPKIIFKIIKISEMVNKNYDVAYNTKIWYNFNIAVGKAFENITFYYASTFDSRLRNYPWGWAFHRASGVYKNLLNFEESFELSDDGLKNLKLYLMANIKNSSKTIDEILNLYQINIYPIIIKNLNLDISKINIKEIFPDLIIKNPFSFKLAFLELCSYYKDPKIKTNFIIDIDQSSSGPQIYSFISRSYESAKLSNIISGKVKEDIYLNFLNNLNLDQIKIELIYLNKIILEDNNLLKLYQKKEYQNLIKISYNTSNLNNGYKNIKNIIDEIFDVLNTREFGKKIVMPAFYGLGLSGIREIITNIVSDLIIENKIPSDFELSYIYKILLSILSLNCLDVLKYNFPLIMAEMQKIKLSTETIVETSQDPSFVIKTLDGCILSLKYPKPIIFKRSFNFSGKSHTFRDYKPSKNLLSSEHLTSMSPNIVQSIDGTIVRILMHEISEKFYVECLHDSFRAHPNNIIEIDQILKEIYFFIFANSEEKEKYIKQSTLKFLNTIYYEESIKCTGIERFINVGSYNLDTVKKLKLISQSTFDEINYLDKYNKIEMYRLIKITPILNSYLKLDLNEIKNSSFMFFY